MEIMKRVDRERLERRTLCPDAAFSDASAGRERPIEQDEYRTVFQRDRDRIIHCKAFRRLSHKTQVFLAPEGDHYRTRLTHTLEVAQISRTIARALGLNEDLTEAIALGHDLGHTPFGHTGERALSAAIARRLGDVRSQPSAEGSLAHEYFSHNRQSLRVVDYLERDGEGLDLTYEVRDGILCHTGLKKAATLEGRIVGYSDRIAYVNHDIDDAIRGGIITEDEVPQQAHAVLGKNHSDRIDTLVDDMISESARVGDICMSERVWNAMDGLRDYLFEKVYTSSTAKNETPKAGALIEKLFDYYLEHIEDVPEENRRIAAEHPSDVTPDDPDCTAVVDLIAGMTDRYAVSVYTDLFIPRNWQRG